MATLAANMTLQQEIRAAIMSHTSLDKKPPCSATELVTMALAVHDRPMVIPDIMMCIGPTLLYYSSVPNLYGERLIDHSTTQERQCPIVLDISLFSGFYPLRLPANIISAERLEDRWQVRCDEARFYLRGALGFRPQGTFPFLELPGEVGNEIYGWYCAILAPECRGPSTQKAAKKTIAVVPGDPTAPFDVLMWKQVQPGRSISRPTFTEPIHRTLGLLLVNKQIFQEAMSHFYRNNLFYFNGIANLYQFLRNTPAYQRQHLTQLAFDYSGFDTGLKQAPAAFKILASLAALRKLYIHHDYHMLRTPRRTVDEHKAAAMRIPGATAWKQISGLEEAVFRGHCGGDVEAAHRETGLEEAE